MEIMIIYAITIQRLILAKQSICNEVITFFFLIFELFKLEWQKFQYGFILNTPLFAFPDA